MTVFKALILAAVAAPLAVFPAIAQNANRNTVTAGPQATDDLSRTGQAGGQDTSPARSAPYSPDADQIGGAPARTVPSMVGSGAGTGAGGHSTGGSGG